MKRQFEKIPKRKRKVGMEGKSHHEDAKNKISESLKRHYKNFPDQKIERHRKISYSKLQLKGKSNLLKLCTTSKFKIVNVWCSCGYPIKKPIDFHKLQTESKINWRLSSETYNHFIFSHFYDEARKKKLCAVLWRSGRSTILGSNYKNIIEVYHSVFLELRELGYIHKSETMPKLESAIEIPVPP